MLGWYYEYEIPVAMNAAVLMAQKYYCGEDLQERALSLGSEEVDGFFDAVKDVYVRLLTWRKEKLCSVTTNFALEELKLPKSMIWAVNIAYGWICNA